MLEARPVQNFYICTSMRLGFTRCRVIFDLASAVREKVEPAEQVLIRIVDQRGFSAMWFNCRNDTAATRFDHAHRGKIVECAVQSTAVPRELLAECCPIDRAGASQQLVQRTGVAICICPTQKLGPKITGSRVK